jgi:K+-transporting ATPase ATPase A chain
MSATVAALLQVGLLVGLLAAVYLPFGNYLAAVYTSERHWRVERIVYRLVRVDPYGEQRWTGLLPPRLGRGPVDPGIAFNTAVSFVTNTNWQSYMPEQVMGHLVQMAGLTVQNFVSAAVGIAVAIALVRGFARSDTDRIGNFWVEIGRAHV